MANLMSEFINSLTQRDRSPKTLRGYKSDLEAFASWFEKVNGEFPTPDRITPADIREYRQKMLTVQRRKANTVNRHLASISAYLEWAIEQGMIEHNPGRDVRLVSTITTGPRYLNKREQYALQRAIEKDLQLARMRFPKRWVARERDAALVTFLLHTGLRLQEALAIETTDLTIGERSGEVYVRNGKGNRVRTVPLNAEVRQAIQKWITVRPAETDNTYLWPPVEGDYDGALTGRSVQRLVRRYGEEAGLPGLTPHILRHTFAKNLVDKGVGLEKIAALLGHASLNTTKLYITPNKNDLEQAVGLLETER